MFRARERRVEPVDEIDHVDHVDHESATMWSPRQLVAFVIGVAAIVLGAFAIARTGLDTANLFHPHMKIATLEHTPLLALTELAFGVLMLLCAASPLMGRGLMELLSACALGLGVVTVANFWHARLYHWLGVHHRNGWLFVIVGAVGLGAALFLPTFGRSRRMVRHETRVPEDAGTAGAHA